MAYDSRWIPRNIHMESNTWEAARARAHDLHVSVSSLVRDVFEAWLAQTTQWDDPIFNRPPLAIAPVKMPKERYPGYLTALGFEE